MRRCSVPDLGLAWGFSPINKTGKAEGALAPGRPTASAKRLWYSAVICILAVVMLGASSTDPQARFGRIGHNMMCVCSCGQVLLECNHVGCPDSERMIGELRDQVSGPPNGGAGTGGAAGMGAGLAAGGSDKDILNWFVEKYGATVLAAPIRGGFDNLAWIAPITVFILAIFGTAFMVRMWAQRRNATPVRAIPANRVNDAMRDRIRRETEWR